MSASRSRTIDLDQLRAEANHEPIEVIVGGVSFDLPAVLPVSLSLAVNKLAAGKLSAATAETVFRTIVTGLVRDRADELLGLVSLDELQHLVTTAYGVGVGESSASDSSSPNGGKQSRPTLPATTAGS